MTLNIYPTCLRRYMASVPVEARLGRHLSVFVPSTNRGAATFNLSVRGLSTLRRPRKVFVRPNSAFIRSVHQSRATWAAHVSHHPLRSSSQHSEKARSRIDVVNRESAWLWAHVTKLWRENKLKEAVELCRPRLADPFAHVPQPCVATASELRALGDYILANLLAELHIVEGAPLPDPTKNAEMLQTLRRAKFAWSSHFPDQLVMRVAVAQELIYALDRGNLRKEVAEEAMELIRLSKAHLEILRKKSATASDEIKDALVDLMSLHFRCTGLTMKSSQNDATDTIVTSGMEILHDYAQKYPMENRVETFSIIFLSMKSMCVANSGRIHDSLPLAYDAVKKAKILSKSVEDAHPDGDSPELDFLRGVYAPAVLTLVAIMDAGKIKAYQDSEFRDLCMESMQASRLAARLPATRVEGIPLDSNTRIGRHYSVSLLFSSSITDTHSEQVALLERSVEVLLMANAPDLNPFRAYASAPSTIAHEFYIKNLDWTSLSFGDAEHAVSILSKLTPLRIRELGRLLRDPKEVIQSTLGIEGARRLILAELEKIFGLATDMCAKADLEVEKRRAKIALATAFANRGIYEALDSPEVAAATWRDGIATLAVEVTSSFSNGPDIVERERGELLEKLEGYLTGNS